MDPVDRLMEMGLAQGVFPGAALLCASQGRPVLERAYGAARRTGGTRLMTLDTRFDLASLSKALGTSVVAMEAVGQGQVSLEEPLCHRLPVGGDLGRVAMRHLLSHSSGLPAWRPLYQELECHLQQSNLEISRDERRQWIRHRLAGLALEYQPGQRSVYSDLGFMLLEWLLEQALGERIDRVLDRTHLGPLGLESMGYLDLDAPREAGRGPYAATEDCSWRGRVLEGEVHDQNTFAMGGVCGQAGLFGTVRDVHHLVRSLWLSWCGETSGLKSEVVRLFWTACGVPHSSFRLGWDGPSPTGYSSAGRLMRRDAVGHLGFTGCSLWIDPEEGFWVILLTNRIHPDVDNRLIAEFRPVLHDLLVREVGL